MSRPPRQESDPAAQDASQPFSPSAWNPKSEWFLRAMGATAVHVGMCLALVRFAQAEEPVSLLD